MAATYTRTATITKTFSRIDLLKLQVVIALRRARVASGTVESIRRGVEKGWIRKIVVYGIDANDLVWCQLTLTIDWSQHKIHLAAGRVSVSIDDRWANDTAIELDEALGLFEQFTRAKGLTSTVHVWYTSKEKPATIRQALGFVTSSPVRWAGERQGTTMKIPELDELSVGFDMVP